MNLSAKDPSITFENVTEAVALLFCHTYSPERDFKVRLLWLLFSLEPTFFCFYPTINYAWAVQCRFAFWNTLSSRDSEVLQSSSLSVLISFLCFFGSRVLVVVVISWCCGQVQSQWCITKDLKKGNNTNTKNEGKLTTVSATLRNSHCCACCDSLVLRQIYYVSHSSFFPWFSCGYSYCLLIAWLSIMLLWCLLYSRVVFCGWFS